MHRNRTTPRRRSDSAPRSRPDVSVCRAPGQQTGPGEHNSAAWAPGLRGGLTVPARGGEALSYGVIGLHRPQNGRTLAKSGQPRVPDSPTRDGCQKRQTGRLPRTESTAGAGTSSDAQPRAVVARPFFPPPAEAQAGGVHCGVVELVPRRAHNPEAAGSIPAPASTHAPTLAPCGHGAKQREKSAGTSDCASVDAFLLGAA